MENQIFEGVIIGASGGSIAGISVYLTQYLHQIIRDFYEARRINKWLKLNPSGANWYSTREIASWNNLPESRVLYLCSKDSKIKLSIRDKEGMWGYRANENLAEW